jgi:hypothetical protein
MSTSSTAATVHNAVVVEVGVHANYQVAYFRLRNGLPDCMYQNVYIDIGGNGGRAAYATVLSAKHSGMPLPALTYVRGADGVCQVDLVSG